MTSPTSRLDKLLRSINPEGGNNSEDNPPLVRKVVLHGFGLDPTSYNTDDKNTSAILQDLEDWGNLKQRERSYERLTAVLMQSASLIHDTNSVHSRAFALDDGNELVDEKSHVAVLSQLLGSLSVPHSMRNFQRDQALLNDYLLKVVEDLERLKPAARRRQSQSDGPGITDQGQVALDAIILHFPDGDDPRFSTSHLRVTTVATGSRSATFHVHGLFGSLRHSCLLDYKQRHFTLKRQELPMVHPQSRPLGGSHGACAIDPIQSADTVYPIPQPRSPSPERTPPPQNHRTKGSRTRAREKVKELRTSAGQKLRDGAEGLAKIMTTRGHTSGPDVASDEKPHPTFASDGIMHVGRRSRQPRNAKREEDDSPVKPAPGTYGTADLVYGGSPNPSVESHDMERSGNRTG